MSLQDGLVLGAVLAPTVIGVGITLARTLMPECKEGETKCMELDLYRCYGGRYYFVEGNSLDCGYEPPLEEVEVEGFTRLADNDHWPHSQQDIDQLTHTTITSTRIWATLGSGQNSVAQRGVTSNAQTGAFKILLKKGEYLYFPDADRFEGQTWFGPADDRALKFYRDTIFIAVGRYSNAIPYIIHKPKTG